MLTILYLPSRKSALNTIDDRHHKCIYEAASDNGMGRMERDGNSILPFGNIAILPLGNIGFPFALDCDLNGIQHCSRAIL